MRRLAADAVLLVVDCQNGFISEHSAPIIPAVARLMKEWRMRGMPVYASRFINYPNSPYERLIHWTKCASSPEIDIVDELKNQLGSGVCVVEKSVYSFFTPKWGAHAKTAQWSDVVIAGIDTDGCVLKTALDAFELDLTPWVVTDATASHSGERAYDAALYIAGRTIGGGQLVDVERIIGALPAGAGIWRG